MRASRGCAESSQENPIAELYLAIRPLLFRVAFRVTGNQADAEDAIHDAFLAILSRADSLESPRAYASVAVRNHAISAVRERRKEAQLIEHITTRTPVPEPTPRTTVRLAAYANAAGDRRLPAVWRGIAAGRTYREIGCDLGITAGAVKSLVFRSRRRLQQLASNGGDTWS